MGLLSKGSALTWEETRKYADHVRQHGIQQLIHQWKKLKVREGDCLRWGDEIEYILIKVDEVSQTARVLLKAPEVLDILQKPENEGQTDLATLWRVEYPGYMIEASPGKPYGHRMADFNLVEANMAKRRAEAMQLLHSGEILLSITSFARLGCPNFSEPAFSPTPRDGVTRSLFFPDDVIYPNHPRFKTLSRNIRERRGAKVAINIPIYQDENTPKPFVEDLSQFGDTGESADAAKPDHIYMDAMGFGMGCSCLQMTFQATNIEEARFLYDMLTPLTPILMALSAASPIFRGYLADLDCRWSVIAASVDDRTKEELGEEPLKENRFRIQKSRYDSIDCYLTSARYNDIEVVKDKEIEKKLLDAGLDELLAQHFAHLFIRDPVSLFAEKIEQDDEKSTDHFENIQSTNWQTMRFKPPPPDSTIGWRVEFRPTEVQLTDFENAALSVFIVLMTRVILSYRLNTLIPISKVDENISRALKRDAIRTQKFYFRKDIVTEDSPSSAAECAGRPCETKLCGKVDDEYEEMTIDEIINGKPDGFMGLVPLLQNFLQSMDDIDVDTSCTISQYISLISKRASGELMTPARYVREFVSNHPEYKKDSVITEKINYDLICECDKITRGEVKPEKLLRKYKTKTAEAIPKAVKNSEKRLCNKMGDKTGVCADHNDTL